MHALRIPSVTPTTSPATPSSPHRLRLLLKAIEGAAPACPDESGAVWSVQNVSGALEKTTDAASGQEDDGCVENTLAAFRDALDRTDDVDSATDLLGTRMSETEEDDLDHFTPAFRRVLDGDPETESTDAGRTQDAESSCSLDYFAPAFRTALGQEGSTDSGREVQTTASPTSDESPASLDYFTPALP